MTEEQTERLIKALESINFYLGALASHGQMLVRFEAAKAGVPGVWWDPTVEPWPKPAEHGSSADLPKLMRYGIPKEHRKVPS